MTDDLDIAVVRATAIAKLNDAFRKAGPSTDWVVASRIHARGAGFVGAALQAVMRFDAFDADNDPYGEHDFGSLTVQGVKVWFKVDCYDETLDWGSPDPTDPSVTRRVLTIMEPSD